jgi:hypothetical protein
MRTMSRLAQRAVPPIAFALLSACATAPRANSSQMPASGCPVAGWTWVRWNDAYGLNVVGIVQAVPGWTFSFSPRASVIGPGEVKVVLVPRPIDPAHPPTTSDQHVYGYWSHASIGAKPNWVQVQCGRLTLQRFNTTPRDLFNPEPAEPPPTVPPSPPPRSGSANEQS